MARGIGSARGGRSALALKKTIEPLEEEKTFFGRVLFSFSNPPP